MSIQNAKIKQKQPFPVAGNEDSIFWMQEVATTADGAPRYTPVANDTLYDFLESRYGGGFAQWVIDGMAAPRA